MATDPARVVAAVRRAKLRNEVRKSVSPAVAQYQEMVFGHNVGPTLPRDPMQFLAGTFTPLTPIQPVPVNVPDEDDVDRPGPRQREMPVGWNMPIGVPGSEGFKLASFGTLRMYADIYSVARACIQLRKNEIRGLEWDVMPTVEAERRMRGDVAAHREFAERRAKVVKFFRKPDPDYLSFGSYVDAIIEEMLVTDALSLYIHPTKKKGAGPFGSDVAALEIISGSTIRPLVNTRGGRVQPPSPGYQQYLYGVPRVDLMEILAGKEDEQIKELGKPNKEYRGDQLMYVPYTQRSWTPYGFPPLERTLIPTITGLRKQQFQMDFFDEGTIPGNYISPGEQLAWTPNQLQIWQNQNNAIAGDPAWKHKSIALPPGSKVFPMKPIPIADQSDEVIMSQVCMGYDVEPMELGVSPKVSATQSAGAANQMAKASQDKQQRKSTKPTLSFITDIFNVLIQVIWGQDDMRFVFEGLEENEDENALVDKLVQLIQYGLSSIDEARIALGKSPWGLPITSDPVYVSPTAGMVPLGSIDPTSGKPMGTPPPAAVGAAPPPGGGGPPGLAAAGAPGAPRPGQPPALGASPGGHPAGSPGGAPASQQVAGQATGPDQHGKFPEPVKLGEDGQPIKPGAPGYDSQHPAPPPKLHPDDKVGQARQDAQEAHAGVQAQMHQDYASGKPLEPPVRPPVQSEDTAPVKGPQTKAILSELDALRRNVKKGRRVEDWQPRHLPDLIVEHFDNLLKMLSVDDAYRVTRQFVIQCFGPPTIQAELDKVFDTVAPVDSSDGKQGLAPMEYQGEKPIEQSYCQTCRKEHAPGKHSQFDNGATADTGPNGATKNLVAYELEPSTVVLPKARGTATTASSWAGWRYDKQLTAYYAAELRRALHAAVDVEAIVRNYLASQQVSKGAMSNLAQQAWSWLTGQGVQAVIQAAINGVMQNLYAEGFAVGKESALEQLPPKAAESAYESAFWDDWKPGDASAARLVAGPGLQELLDGYGIQTIKAVTQTRMKDLANALAEGFEEGDSADQITKDIRQILIKPQRALMIAGTELARATVQASVKEYIKADQDAKAWSGTPDGRICPGCKKNVEQGYIPIGQAFKSGALWPPGHPECRCAPLPGKLPASVSGIPDLTLIKSRLSDGVVSSLLTEYLGSGLTYDDFQREVLKVGPKGYVHGWIKVDDPAALASDLKSGVADEKTHKASHVVKETTYGTGRTWFHKAATKDQQDADKLSVRVSRVLGTEAPSVHSKGGRLYSAKVSGQTASEKLGLDDYSVDYRERAARALPYLQSDQGKRIGLQDLITGNTDRTDKNWMIDEHDHPVPIDHGRAQYSRKSMESTGPFATKLQGTTGNWSADQWNQWQSGLESLQPEYEAAGRSAWYGSLMSGFEAEKARDLSQGNVSKAAPPRDVVAAGLAVRARDTGRVLMIQRAHDEDDPAGGMWEFPGGRLDDGETPLEAARREFEEETGLPVPPGNVASTWDQGPYRCHVVHVRDESAVPILDRSKGTNPDDPANDSPEAVAWWDPAELKDNPAVRTELQEHPKRVRRALEAGGEKISKGLLADMATSLEVAPQTVFDQLSENYPPESIAWVLRATWHGPYLVPWNKIDHDDMDSWAASHQPERVDHFAQKIGDGEDVKPVILVADPDGDFIDVDGHHRALAYHKLERPVRGYVGRIRPEDRHAMEETHLDQVHEGADPKNE